jgi:hypothetical protein
VAISPGNWKKPAYLARETNEASTAALVVSAADRVSSPGFRESNRITPPLDKLSRYAGQVP